MARSRDPGFVDGYTALKAAQRAAGKEHPKPSAPKEPSKKKDPKKSDDVKKPGMHIGRTTLPTKYEVVCYECGFSFQQTGRSQTTLCPKCRVNLDFIDYTIHTEWTDSLKTAGTVRITADAVIRSGEIIGADVILEGKLDGGKIHATRWLEFTPTAVYEEKDFKARDLRIGEGVSVTLRRRADFRNVEVRGTLKAKVHASGLVSVKAGGLLQGEVHGEHLDVEEGGGLKAKVGVQHKEPAEEIPAPLKKTA